jgi:hypothetical protein
MISYELRSKPPTDYRGTTVHLFLEPELCPNRRLTLFLRFLKKKQNFNIFKKTFDRFQ